MARKFTLEVTGPHTINARTIEGFRTYARKAGESAEDFVARVAVLEEQVARERVRMSEEERELQAAIDQYHTTNPEA